MPEELSQQLPWIQKLTAAMGITVVEKPGVEADDLLAHYAQRYSDDSQVLIVSADKDFIQVVGIPLLNSFRLPPQIHASVGVA